MKLFTIHSPSHQPLFDIMEDSLYKNCPDIELISETTEQVSKDTNYGEGDSLNFKMLKVKYIRRLLYTETEPFIFADVDIYYFRSFVNDLKNRLNGYDFVAQNERKLYGLFQMICSGFMYMKPNKRMQDAYDWVEKNLHKFRGDQMTLNKYLFTHPFLKKKALPKEYYSINFDNDNKVWDGEDIKITVKNPCLVHLHWTLGLENRLRLLEKVKGVVK